MCENIWRNNVCPAELDGLEKLQEAISLVSCYDLGSSLHEHNEKKPLWTSVVYDYRCMSSHQIQQLGWPKNM